VVLTPAEVEDFLKPTAFRWADEEFEHQELFLGAPNNTEFGGNGAFPEMEVAIGQTELAIKGAAGNKVWDIVEGGKLTPPRATVVNEQVDADDTGNSTKEAGVSSSSSRFIEAC